MQLSEERKSQRNEVINWKLELFEYLRSSPFHTHATDLDRWLTVVAGINLLDKNSEGVTIVV